MTAPNRSAIAPANGWPSPHSRFWIASARPKTVAAPVLVDSIGCMKKPSVERGPKLSIAIRQPQMMMTSGRPPGEAAAGRCAVVGNRCHASSFPGLALRVRRRRRRAQRSDCTYAAATATVPTETKAGRMRCRHGAAGTSGCERDWCYIDLLEMRISLGRG